MKTLLKSMQSRVPNVVSAGVVIVFGLFALALSSNQTRSEIVSLLKATEVGGTAYAETTDGTSDGGGCDGDGDGCGSCDGGCDCG